MQWLFSNALWLLAVIVASILIILGLIKLLFNKLEGEKLTTYLDFTKWIVVSVALVIIANVIDASFKDRAAAINEMQQYDKYVSLITPGDKLADKRRLAQYFKIVTPAKELRARWNAYYDTLDIEYRDSLVRAKKLTDSLIILNMIDTTNKSRPDVAQKIKTIGQQLDNINYQITPTIKTDHSEAAKYEMLGFDALFQRNLDNAIDAFNNSEQRYHGYHGVYDIWFYLRSHREKLASPSNETAWKQAYKDILKRFPWGMPDDVKQKLEDLSR